MYSILPIYSLLQVQDNVPTITQTGGTVYNGSWTTSGNTYTSMLVYDTAGSSNRTFSLSRQTTVYLLMLGGGGGGGPTINTVAEPGAGGGAGRAIYGTIQLNGNVTYNVTVGQAGAGGVAPGTGVAGVAPGTGGNTTLVGTGVNETAFGGGRAGYNILGSTGTSTQSGGAGGCGGGSINGWGIGSGGTASTGGTSTTNPRSLTYGGYAGGTGAKNGSSGGGGGCTSVGGGGAAPGSQNTSTSRGGSGFLFDVTGTTNDFINQYYGVGGCAGSGDGLTLDHSSITSVGGVIGGTLTKTTPDNAVTFGSGGSGAYSKYGTVAANGGNGKSGIVIILVP